MVKKYWPTFHKLQYYRGSIHTITHNIMEWNDNDDREHRIREQNETAKPSRCLNSVRATELESVLCRVPANVYIRPQIKMVVASSQRLEG